MFSKDKTNFNQKDLENFIKPELLDFSINSSKVSNYMNCISIGSSVNSESYSLCLKQDINYNYDKKDLLKRRLHLQDIPSEYTEIAHMITNQHFFKHIVNSNNVKINKINKKTELDKMLNYDIVNLNNNKNFIISRQESLATEKDGNSIYLLNSKKNNSIEEQTCTSNSPSNNISDTKNENNKDIINFMQNISLHRKMNSIINVRDELYESYEIDTCQV